MHRFRDLCLGLLALMPLAVGADIAVWKGAGTQTADTSEIPAKAKVNIYFIVDLQTFVGRIVVALPSTRQVYDEGDRSYGLNVHPTSPRETFYLTDAIETTLQNGPIEYNPQIAHLGGKTTKN